MSAHTRGWPRSIRPTPTITSVVSASSRSWSPASSEARSWAWSAHPAAASHPLLRAGLIPALAGGVLPGSEHVDRRGHAARRASAERARARRSARAFDTTLGRPSGRGPTRARRRPVRGGIQLDSRRGRAAAQFIELLSAEQRRPQGRPGDARRSLRPLRRVPNAGAADRQQPDPRRSADARRAGCGHRTPGGTRRPACRARIDQRAAGRPRRGARRAPAALDGAARALAGSATAVG